MDHIATQKAETELDIQMLEQTLYDIKQASPKELAAIRLGLQPTKKAKPQQPVSKPKQFKLGDVVFYVGQNAKQNEIVTFELAHSSDLWLHVKDAPGAHVIAKTTNVTEAVLRFAANLAACHSASKHSSSVEVQYTTKKQIKKIPGYPGSTVQVLQYKTIFIDPDCRAIEGLIPSHTKSE
jgi:predicted ribosome quality control (RQC) complex YloA/Tae2 family protein